VQNARHQISIVSDGLDRVISHLLERESIKIDHVWANHLVEDGSGGLKLQFPKPGNREVCPSGLCKCQVLDQAGSSVIKTVIGDGRSDFCWAQNADLLFCQRQVAQSIANNKGLAHVPIRQFRPDSCAA